MLGLVMLVVVLALVLFVVRPVVKKTRAEDVPATLVGLGHVIEALSSFVPWNSRRSSTQASKAPAALSANDQPGGVRPMSPTIITTDRLTVLRSFGLQEDSRIEQLPAASGGGE
ncbi:hypothetical protein OG858_47140 (plasmid) [Streptomyces europaeiscabiei]|uniref:hypothetical protein n=1 Tax=Streptomyces europaeiscabiei TaxID=146819 RepID=UPI002E820F26|nr:hypothetical protein [Streptomyces europaeiscabiei]WUD38884.1 hypothetical protein OG858_47140 [Streptomyces europaeiscabiei]